MLAEAINEGYGRPLDPSDDYVEAAGHAADADGALFRPVKNNRTKERLGKALSPDSVYQSIVIPYAKKLGISIEMFGPHALRATAATNALEHDCDIAKVQEWLGHANISDHQALRSAAEAARGESHVQSGILRKKRA